VSVHYDADGRGTFCAGAGALAPSRVERCRLGYATRDTAAFVTASHAHARTLRSSSAHAAPVSSPMTTTPTPVDRPTASGSHARWALLYDADCGFCKWIVSGVLAWDRHNRLVPRALQSAPAQTLLSDLSPEERLASVHLISPDGERLSAGSVPAPLLRLLPGGTIPALGIARLPRLTSRAYDWVANHRSQLSRAVPTRMKRRASARVNRMEVEHAENP
jgi:predicted DCC family thiol-disulfide oxidoreductase YuxK